MKVLVDTSVWSLALRRAKPTANAIVAELVELIAESRVEMIGAIRQELLSGLRQATKYHTLREQLRAFPDLVLDNRDYETAADHFNECRAVGLQGSNTDFLICAVAKRRSLAVFTADNDFDAFAPVLGFVRHEARARR